MLKYVLIFSMISCYNSMDVPGLIKIPGRYEKLVLVQRSPAAVIFEQEYKLGNEGVVANRKAIKALRELRIKFEARTWIINNLFAANGSISLRHCSFSRTPLMYDSRALNKTFRAELIKIWPNLDEELTDNRLWNKIYRNYGCCVIPNTLGYFEKAAKLIENWNIGKILTGSEIHPGGTYELSRIMESIKNVSRTSPYVGCLSDQNSWSDEQYLLEVQICFNNNDQFMDCDTRAHSLCDPTKLVFYPGSPEP